VSKALREEIDCLSELVDEFNLPFHPEQHDLNEYKKELNHHVEKCLGSKLHASLSTELVKYTENSQREMTGNK
jgi:mitofusin